MIKKFLNKIFNNNSNAISFKQGFDLTELPICTFYQGEKKFNFLLDTGSNSCIIDSNVLDQIKSTVINTKTSLYGLEGTKIDVSMCKIALDYKDNTYEFEYLIKDMGEPFNNIKQDTGVTLHGILGSKFFNKFKYVLDFDELIAYSKK